MEDASGAYADFVADLVADAAKRDEAQIATAFVTGLPLKMVYDGEGLRFVAASPEEYWADQPAD